MAVASPSDCCSNHQMQPQTKQGAKAGMQHVLSALQAAGKALQGQAVPFRLDACGQCFITGDLHSLLDQLGRTPPPAVVTDLGMSRDGPIWLREVDLVAGKASKGKGPSGSGGSEPAPSLEQRCHAARAIWQSFGEVEQSDVLQIPLKDALQAAAATLAPSMGNAAAWQALADSLHVLLTTHGRMATDLRCMACTELHLPGSGPFGSLGEFAQHIVACHELELKGRRECIQCRKQILGEHWKHNFLPELLCMVCGPDGCHSGRPEALLEHMEGAGCGGQPMFAMADIIRMQCRRPKDWERQAWPPELPGAADTTVCRGGGERSGASPACGSSSGIGTGSDGDVAASSSTSSSSSNDLWMASHFDAARVVAGLWAPLEEGEEVGTHAAGGDAGEGLQAPGLPLVQLLDPQAGEDASSQPRSQALMACIKASRRAAAAAASRDQQDRDEKPAEGASDEGGGDPDDSRELVLSVSPAWLQALHEVETGPSSEVQHLLRWLYRLSCHGPTLAANRALGACPNLSAPPGGNNSAGASSGSRAVLLRGTLDTVGRLTSLMYSCRKAADEFDAHRSFYIEHTAAMRAAAVQLSTAVKACGLAPVEEESRPPGGARCDPLIMLLAARHQNTMQCNEGPEAWEVAAWAAARSWLKHMREAPEAAAFSVAFGRGYKSKELLLEGSQALASLLYHGSKRYQATADLVNGVWGSFKMLLWELLQDYFKAEVSRANAETKEVNQETDNVVKAKDKLTSLVANARADKTEALVNQACIRLSEVERRSKAVCDRHDELKARTDTLKQEHDACEAWGAALSMHMLKFFGDFTLRMLSDSTMDRHRDNLGRELERLRSTGKWRWFGQLVQDRGLPVLLQDHEPGPCCSLEALLGRKYLEEFTVGLEEVSLLQVDLEDIDRADAWRGHLMRAHSELRRVVQGLRNAALLLAMDNRPLEALQGALTQAVRGELDRRAKEAGLWDGLVPQQQVGGALDSNGIGLNSGTNKKKKKKKMKMKKQGAAVVAVAAHDGPQEEARWAGDQFHAQQQSERERLRREKGMVEEEGEEGGGPGMGQGCCGRCALASPAPAMESTATGTLSVMTSGDPHILLALAGGKDAGCGQGAGPSSHKWSDVLYCRQERAHASSSSSSSSSSGSHAEIKDSEKHVVYECSEGHALYYHWRCYREGLRPTLLDRHEEAVRKLHASFWQPGQVPCVIMDCPGTIVELAVLEGPRDRRTSRHHDIDKSKWGGAGGRSRGGTRGTMSRAATTAGQLQPSSGEGGEKMEGEEGEQWWRAYEGTGPRGVAGGSTNRLQAEVQQQKREAAQCRQSKQGKEPSPPRTPAEHAAATRCKGGGDGGDGHNVATPPKTPPDPETLRLQEYRRGDCEDELGLSAAARKGKCKASPLAAPKLLAETSGSHTASPAADAAGRSTPTAKVSGSRGRRKVPKSRPISLADLLTPQGGGSTGQCNGRGSHILPDSVATATQPLPPKRSGGGGNDQGRQQRHHRPGEPGALALQEADFPRLQGTVLHRSGGGGDSDNSSPDDKVATLLQRLKDEARGASAARLTNVLIEGIDWPGVERHHAALGGVSGYLRWLAAGAAPCGSRACKRVVLFEGRHAAALEFGRKADATTVLHRLEGHCEPGLLSGRLQTTALATFPAEGMLDDD